MIEKKNYGDKESDTEEGSSDREAEEDEIVSENSSEEESNEEEQAVKDIIENESDETESSYSLTQYKNENHCSQKILISTIHVYIDHEMSKMPLAR